MAAGESPNEAFGKGGGAGELTEARSLALARFLGVGGRVVGDGVGERGREREEHRKEGRGEGKGKGVGVGVSCLSDVRDFPCFSSCFWFSFASSFIFIFICLCFFFKIYSSCL